MTSTVFAIALSSAATAIVVSLIILLVMRELLDASERPDLKVLASDLAIFTTPLLIVILTIVLVEALKASF
jgi:hypothetical protein